MSVSKRTRFEILRRDNHACRYCGSMAPDVTLHVDHVMPVALGGGDDPSNLVTACKECNAGKSSTSPDENVVAEVSDKALALASAFRVALDGEAQSIRKQRAYQKAFATAWEAWVTGTSAIPLPREWRETIAQWYRIGVPLEVVENAIDVAMAKPGLSRTNGEFRYMCGVVWRTLDNAQRAVSAEPKPKIPFSHLHLVECASDECEGGALFEDEDEEDPYCSSCSNMHGWQAGYTAATQVAS